MGLFNNTNVVNEGIFYTRHSFCNIINGIMVCQKPASLSEQPLQVTNSS